MNAPAVTSEVGEEVLERKRFSGAEWDRMLAAGLFDEDERLELIDGEVVVRSPIGDLHDDRTRRARVRARGRRGSRPPARGGARSRRTGT